MRIAYTPDMGGIPVDPAVAAVVEEALRALEAAGAHVEPVELQMPADQLELSHLWSRLITPLNLDGLESMKAAGIDLLGEHRDELPPMYVEWMEQGLAASARDVARDQALRTGVFEAIQAAFADHDLLVSPTLGALPVENADVAGETIGPTEINGVEVDPLIGWCLTYALNFTGHPAASVPAGLANGLPVGMQIVGRLGADVDVLAASAVLERVRPWTDAYALCEQRALTA
jgi:amidase/aspartyl-tRNA(Asn)/glutamyl-tRNA(Gln) amidotransferase subunit A